jgi:hypothetical protein
VQTLLPLGAYSFHMALAFALAEVSHKNDQPRPKLLLPGIDNLSSWLLRANSRWQIQGKMAAITQVGFY